RPRDVDQPAGPTRSGRAGPPGARPRRTARPRPAGRAATRRRRRHPRAHRPGLGAADAVCRRTGRDSALGGEAERGRPGGGSAVRLLFVTGLGRRGDRGYTRKWGSRMKLLVVFKLERAARSVNTLTKYVQAGQALGHEVALFGEQQSEVPGVPTSLDVKAFDYAVFVIHETKDFPDLPYLAQLLDGMPKERRAVIDCGGRYHDTSPRPHDLQPLAQLDNPPGLGG